MSDQTATCGVGLRHYEVVSPEIYEPGSEYTMRCDTVLLAVGYSVRGLDLGHPEILKPDGTVRITGEGGMTELPGVFVGGDVVRGAYTVVHAIRDGRLASDAIARYLLERPMATKKKA